MFWNRPKIKPEWLIIGLGNPGKKYELTRHNAGFFCVDRIAREQGVSFKKKAFDSLYAACNINGQDCLLLKPQTYMNLSGEAVFKAMKHFGLGIDRILVIADDISFNVGSIRIRKSGSSGGQKGVNNVITVLGSEDFVRIKVGAGKRPQEIPTVDWVLSDFSQNELLLLDEVTGSVALAVGEIVNGNTDTAMGKYNKTV
jgi:PTH1 family peptidyl-tRNA hydrolase